MKHLLSTVAVSAVTALTVFWGMGKLRPADTVLSGQLSGAIPANYKFAALTEGSGTGQPVDFTQSAQASLPGVVHIKTKTNARQVTNNSLPRMQQNPFGNFFGDDLFEQFFGPRNFIIPEQKASGSGVLISENGYIVTNNHVIAAADEITVTLNDKKSYKATVVGNDPAYDLAVIKIDGQGLPYLLYGNSDDVKIGQWVLAIGYPLNLETTVTAGIVSAKSRSLGLNKDRNGSVQGSVEAFIQTDAAVNMGNSGGALVNTDGLLIGVNSAIASPTGYYSGYSYAIPVNIVKKVVDDIIRYGTVQRAYLGISCVNAGDMSEEEKSREDIPLTATGVYINEVSREGGSYAAGIRKGDILKKINGVEVATSAEMLEQVSRYKPGDKISVTYARNGKDATATVTLKNKAGNYELVKKDAPLEALGGEFTTLNASKAAEYGVNGGVIVSKITENGALNDQTRMKDGFVILKVDNKNVSSVEDLRNAVNGKKSITLSGFYPGYEGLYQYPLSLE